jgi:hypothetical protein
MIAKSASTRPRVDPPREREDLDPDVDDLRALVFEAREADELLAEALHAIDDALITAGPDAKGHRAQVPLAGGEDVDRLGGALEQSAVISGKVDAASLVGRREHPVGDRERPVVELVQELEIEEHLQRFLGLLGSDLRDHALGDPDRVADEVRLHRHLADRRDVPARVVRAVLLIEALRRTVAAMAGEPLIRVDALGGGLRLVEGDEVDEVRGLFAFEAEGLRVAGRHVVGEPALAFDHELEVVRRVQAGAARERAEREAAALLLLLDVVVGEVGAVVEVVEDAQRFLGTGLHVRGKMPEPT